MIKYEDMVNINWTELIPPPFWQTAQKANDNESSATLNQSQEGNIVRVKSG